MNSTKCSECGFVGWADAETCKKCGAVTRPGSVDPNHVLEAHQSYATTPSFNQDGPRRELKKSLAIWSLVVGIVSCLTFGGIFGLGATVGLTLGIIAMVKANRHPVEYGGKGLATAGIVSSALSIVIIAPIGIIAAIAIPNLLGARMAANEGSSIAVLRKISAAESTYLAAKGKYGDLDELASEHLIDSNLASSEHNGYRFTISGHSDPDSFEASGVPVTYRSTGIRSFYIDETGVIRVADRHGSEATKLDSPLNNDRYSSSPYSRSSDSTSGEAAIR